MSETQDTVTRHPHSARIFWATNKDDAIVKAAELEAAEKTFCKYWVVATPGGEPSFLITEDCPLYGAYWDSSGSYMGGRLA